MTSRRPMTRSFSTNGRTSSFSEDEGSSSNGRTESRNMYLSNVRPENSYSRYSHHRPTRSTLCSVMAQLTEDIQPSFDTTLKSKAVSENCNVKFTCVVSGYPAPELKWYKDDTEMDRYCGLPKYEIRRNGKTHTLHIYNCTLDDAAIYQVSASNSKGIVSCSGVLEVGTMNEYQIHQRFFAKLKQKAERKRKELDEQTKKDKENILKEKPQIAPERPPRKRHTPLPQDRPVVKEPDAIEQVGAVAEANGVTMETGPVTSTDSGLEKEAPLSMDTLAKKKMKTSDGADLGVNSSSSSSGANRSHMMGNGGENCYDGGLSLAQFLAETLTSQAAEEKQSRAEVNVLIANDTKEERMQKESEQEQGRALEEAREKRREEDLAGEREREEERPLEVLHTTAHSKHPGKASKDHDHHHIQTSITSMLHTVKDFFFGKTKKDSHDQTEHKSRLSDHDPVKTPQPETPPSFWLKPQPHPDVPQPLVEDIVPMETNDPTGSSESADVLQPLVSSETHKGKEKENDDTHLPAAEKMPPGRAEEAAGQRVQEADDSVEVMEVSLGAGSSSPSEAMPLSGLQVLTELEHRDSQVVSFVEEVPVNPQEVVSLQPDRQATGDECPPREEISVSSQAKALSEEEHCPPTTTVTILEVSRIPPDSVLPVSDHPSHGQAANETQEEQLSVAKAGENGKPDAEDSRSSSQMCEKEKAEVKSSEQACSDINRPEMTELTAPSLEERIETCDYKTPDQVIPCAPAVAAYNVEMEGVREETESASKTQEVTEGFPPTAGQESLERVDLETQPECILSIVEESEQVHSVSVVQSSTSGFRANEERSDFEEVPNLTSVKVLGLSLWDNLKREEHTVSDVANAEARHGLLPLGVEAEKRAEEVEGLDKSNVCSVTQNEGSNAILLEEHSKITHEDGGERQTRWPSESIPQIQISIVDDDKDIKPAVPDVNKYEQFIIPKIEIMESELKESTILDFSLPESEPAILQKHDATQMMIVQEKGMTDSAGLPPTQKGMQNNYSLPPTETVTEVAQLCDETKMSEQGQPHVKRSEQLPQMDYTSVPLINVLCTDDKENDAFVNARASHALQPSDTQVVPLFVVPPISVTCHDSCPGVALPTHSEWTETETSTDTQRGREPDADGHVNLTSEKGLSERQKLEEVAEKLQTESGPSSLCEGPIKKPGNNVSLLSNPTEETTLPETVKIKPSKEAKTETLVSMEDIQRNRFSIDRLSSKPPAHPSLSPASLRKFMSKAALDSDNETVTPVPVITVGDHQSDKVDEDLSGGSTPTLPLSCESSPRLKRRDSLTLIRSATPEELASGARRKIFIPKTKEDGDAAVASVPDAQGKKETPYMSPSQARRAALLQAPKGQNTPPMERRSPLLNRRKATLEVPKVTEETPKEEPARREEKPAEKKFDPLKAPQVIRKIRGEPFPDASGHLKLWCMFFNVLSDSTIKWYRDEEEILEVTRSGGDESQVALAIVLASRQDCGVYGCTINNEYGTDTTDFLLSEDILSEILLKDDLEVGEEIEMTPLLFTKGLVDSGSWGEKYFGRIMTEIAHLGEGCNHKACRVKVIYGLDPVFDSGSNCIIKVQSPIAYGTKQESNLAERNLEITKQECKIQNMIREYCKIFAAEARVNENFGFSLEVIPKYLMYRPANTVPYATVEESLDGVFLQYCRMDPKGGMITRTVSEVEQKCCTFQHWIHQWTHGNLLVTRLEGVETKLTNVGVVTKSKGYQGLTERGSPEVFEQFQTQHQCNYYCGLLGLRPMKMDGLQQTTKVKGSRSPLLNRKLSPQLQRKGHSPQMSRKTNSSPKVTRKVQETEDNKTDAKSNPAETADGLEAR